MSSPLAWRPMPLLRVAEPFDQPDWLFELKHDGFRALAIIERGACQLVSRNGHVFGRWPKLCDELARAVRAERVVMDGEITCLLPDGRSDFYALMARSEWPVFYAFDALAIDGEDLRERTLLERKARLGGIMPRDETRLRYVDHVVGRGKDLFGLACAHDTEGIVSKLAQGTYHTDGITTSWLKTKNPALCRFRHNSGYADARIIQRARRAAVRRRTPGRKWRASPTTGTSRVFPARRPWMRRAGRGPRRS